MSLENVNCVMIVRDRPRLTEQALRSFDNGSAESNLTIVDDGSAPQTAAVLSDMRSPWDYIVRVQTPNHRVGELKNLGVAASRTHFGRALNGWLYLSDNDVYFTDSWLHKLITLAHHTEEQGFKLWAGQVHPYHLPVKTHVGMTEHSSLDGPSWLMRWTTWDMYGPFLTSLKPGACQGEDVAFCKRITDDGGRLGAISPHVVYHTGLTHLDGSEAPGANLRRASAIPGVIYE